MLDADTSALMKRHIAKPQEVPFDVFLIAHAPVVTSQWTPVEMRCRLA